jgi:hypothetical protein
VSFGKAGMRRVGFLVLLLAATTACAGPEPSPSAATPSAAPVVAIAPLDPAPVPTPDRAAMDACMAAAGYRVTPGSSGSNGVYSWERSSSYQWEEGDQINPVLSAECFAKFPRASPKTHEEIRVIYNRWVLEWQCLKSLGFHPGRPPTFEDFYPTWATGPWMPINGVPMERLGGRAKDKCGLEMVP